MTRGEPDRQSTVEPGMPPTIRLLTPDDAAIAVALREEIAENKREQAIAHYMMEVVDRAFEPVEDVVRLR